jgi:hypothetical protein
MMTSVRHGRLRGCLVVALLVVHSALLGWEGWRASPTVDEVGHLPAGLSHWKFSRFDLYRVNPPLVRMLAAVPLLFLEPHTEWRNYYVGPYSRPEFTIGSDFAAANKSDIFWYFILGRWACLPLSLIGAWVCYSWSRELYGTPAAFVALILWCFCPNILGNAALITPDCGAAALGAASGYFFWRWLCDARWTRALLAGLALGLAELTKSTWIVLFGLWPLIGVIWAAGNGIVARRIRAASDSASGNRTTADPGAAGALPNNARARLSPILQLFGILLIALNVLNLGYGFEDSFRKLGSFDFISRTLGGEDAHAIPGNRFQGTWLGELPVPVPANYLLGIDLQRYDFEEGKWSYLHGEQKMGGWWYYYLYALGVKVPIGTILLFAVVILLSAFRLASRGFRGWRDDFVVLAPAVVVLVLVSSQTGFNRYLRYVLPIFPFVFVWMSQAGQWLTPKSTGRQSPDSLKDAPGDGADRKTSGHRVRVGIAVVVPLLLLSSVVSSLAVFPHSLSYFNELAGGPLGGPAHLLDANIDWGQDLLELKRWYDAHPRARPFYLAYFGFFDPRLAGLEFQPVPGAPTAGNSNARPASQSGPVPGWHAVSINDLYGYKHIGHETDQYAYLRHVAPTARIGYSIMIYHISVEDANRMRRDLGLHEIPQPQSPTLEIK